jgi:hypothetical protein
VTKDGTAWTAASVCLSIMLWSSSHVLQAICKDKCHGVGGSCSVPGTCECFENWNGTLCSNCSDLWTGSVCSFGWIRDLPSHFFSCELAKCAPGCINGDCRRPGDCICRKGFHGLLCNVAITNTTGTLGRNMCKYADASSSCRQGLSLSFIYNIYTTRRHCQRD